MPGLRPPKAERVARLVIPSGTSLCFGGDCAASFPGKFTADQHPGTGEGIAREKTAVPSGDEVLLNSQAAGAIHQCLKGTGLQRDSRFSTGVALGISQPALTMKGFPACS